MSVQFSAIWACGLNGVIGKNNELPWPKIKEDMKWFRKHTLAKTVVMGYNTWVSLGNKPLPDRQNVVLSNVPLNGVPHLSTCNQTFAGLYWCRPDEFEDNIPKAWDEREVVIIGGAKTYKLFSHLFTRVYQTVVNDCFEGDTFIHDNTDEWDMIYLDRFSSKLCTFQIFEGGDLEIT